MALEPKQAHAAGLLPSQDGPQQLLSVEGPRQRHQQGLVDLGGERPRCLCQAIRPYHHLAAATLADLQRIKVDSFT